MWNEQVFLLQESHSRRTRVLVNDALLPLVEAFTSLVRPPLLQLAVLVVHAACGVEGVLSNNVVNHRD